MRTCFCYRRHRLLQSKSVEAPFGLGDGTGTDQQAAPSVPAAFGALFFVSSEFSENPRNVPKTYIDVPITQLSDPDIDPIIRIH